MSNDDLDFCRVCRCEGTPSKPLFYPCMCTGSIKYVHQDCLVQWLQYSKRQTCELCTHQFTFKPVYAEDTPSVVPPRVLFAGLLSTVRDFGLRMMHTLTVLFSWLFIVPLTVCRIYKCLFSGGYLSDLLSLPLDMLSTEHVIQDCIQGFFIVLVALSAFLGYIWLREQLTIDGEPEWLAAPVAPAQPTNPTTDEGVRHEQAAAANAAANREPEEEVGRQALAPAPINVGEHGAGVGVDDFDVAMGPMNWERIFGLDGTMSFVEHALWLIALSIVFIIIFAALPFFTGKSMINMLGFQTAILTAPIEGVLTTFTGYVAMAIFLITLHTVLNAINMSRTSYFAGLFYIYLKLAIIAFVEVGIFTALCGIWIDACSLGMFNASVSQRIRNFNYAPLVFTFIHWTTGLLYFFYIFSVFILIRDVLRPGIIWFMQDFTDPEYKPIQDMVSVPISTYIQRLIVHFSLAGIVVVLTLWVPTRIIQKFLPGFLPYHLSLVYDSPVDYSVEIILLQILMPIALDGQMKLFMHTALRRWCIFAAWLLNLRSYLLGDVAFQPGDVIVLADGSCVPTTASPTHQTQPDVDNKAPNHDIDVPEEHHEQEQEDDDGVGEDVGMERQGGGGHFKPYIRPSFFELRLVGLLAMFIVSLSGISVAVFVIPVAYGRAIMTETRLASHAPPHDAIALFIGLSNIVFLIKFIIYLPTMTRSVREYASTSVEKLSAMVTLTHWRWLAEQFLALYHRIFRGYSRDPSAYKNGLHVALIALSGGLQEGVGARGGEGLSFQKMWTLFWNVLVSLSIPFKLGSLLLILIGLFPFCLGLLINLVVFIPLRVPPEKTLVLGFPENWIFGVMLLTVGLLVVLVGPRWRLRDGLEELHDEMHLNWPNIRTIRILIHLAPMFVSVALALVLPFLFAHYAARISGVHSTITFRYVYPIFFTFVILIGVTWLLVQQCITLYERIKDENYLVGRRLVNYRVRESTAADNLLVVSG